MDGDLSLSQSLGGLRIANPDNSSLNSSEEPSASSGLATPALTPSPVPQAQLSSSSPSLSSNLRREQPGPSPLHTAVAEEGLEYAHSREPHLSASTPEIYAHHRKNKPSLSHSYQGPQQQHPELQTMTPQNIHNQQGNASRPTSTYYGQPMANGSSPSPATREGSYRIRTESGTESVETPKRSDSRGGSAALQAGVPVRDNSHSDRSYRKSQLPAGQGNGPMPPRRSSRAIGHGHNSVPSHLSGSPYNIEGGPLASSEEWEERGAAVGVRQEVDATGKPVSRYVKKGVRDFSFTKTLGEGSYSTVMLARDRQSLHEYAIKILDKRHIIKEKKVKYVNIEKDTLNRLTDHPGVVRLYYTFQDERSLYFVLDLASGGELLGVLKRMATFDEECTRFYGAEILDTVDYMHRNGVIHRDLKPENVLLDKNMHVKITDFGTAKILQSPRQQEGSPAGFPQMDSPDYPDENRANSFVGTAEYVSPELLTDKSACKASDLWAFGCIIYQLLAGRPPFKASNEYQTFQKIVALDYEFPSGFPPVARDLVERLLVLDPSRRLQIEHIKNHEFFDGITWGRSLWKQKAPRLKSYSPPPPEPIKLNGSNNDDNMPPNIATNAPPQPTNMSTSRPLPRVITELPPPSQLDIEWSPVLNRSNERILKLGNLLVLTSPASQGPNSKGGADGETPKKFSRFFGGSTTKKRQRLVMITSSARIIMAPAGGEEKKAKVEISLFSPGTHYRSTTDSKGFSSWVVDTVRKETF